jgi:F0F1-type ATP synthase assembly protein I
MSVGGFNFSVDSKNVPCIRKDSSKHAFLEAVISIGEKIKVKESCLDLLFVQDLPECFSAALIKSYGELSAFSFLVGFASHLPSFLGVFNVFSTTGTFSHSQLTSFTSLRMN